MRVDAQQSTTHDRGGAVQPAIPLPGRLIGDPRTLNGLCNDSAVTTTTQRPALSHAVELRPFAVFVSAGDEERRRRSADVLTLVIAGFVVLAAALEVAIRQSSATVSPGC